MPLGELLLYTEAIPTKTMTEEQIQMLRRLIKDEIEAAGIDGMEHGAWGWAEKQLDENWEKFRKTFEVQ